MVAPGFGTVGRFGCNRQTGAFEATSQVANDVDFETHARPERCRLTGMHHNGDFHFRER